MALSPTLQDRVSCDFENGAVRCDQETIDAEGGCPRAIPNGQCEWPDDGDTVARNRFGSLGDAMMTLFINGVIGDDLNWVANDVIVSTHDWEFMGVPKAGVLNLWLAIAFFVIAAMTLLNMLIG